MFYTAVFQAMLLYGLDYMFMSTRVDKVLGAFYHRFIRRLTGRMPHWNRVGTWIYPPVGEAVAEVGLQEIETYVTYCQKTVAQYIATSTITYLCLLVGQHPRALFSKWWWEQNNLNMEGIRKAEHLAEAERD